MSQALLLFAAKATELAHYLGICHGLVLEIWTATGRRDFLAATTFGGLDTERFLMRRNQRMNFARSRRPVFSRKREMICNTQLKKWTGAISVSFPREVYYVTYIYYTSLSRIISSNCMDLYFIFLDHKFYNK